MAKSWDADELAARCGILYRLSFHKFYIDEIYAALIKVLVDGIARGLYWLDVYIVDGIVNGLGGVVRLASGWLSPAEMWTMSALIGRSSPLCAGERRPATGPGSAAPGASARRSAWGQRP